MEWLSSIWMITWLLILFFLTKIITSRKNKLRSPPGPKPWPIIGNLNLLGPIPHRSFLDLSKKYGDIMQLKFGSKPVIIVSSREIAKEFLETHDQIWASRGTSAASRLMNYNSIGMSMAPLGPHWRQGRKIYASELLSTKPLDLYEYIRIEERQSLLSQLRKNALEGKPVVLKKHLLRYTLKVITRMALGKNYFQENESLGMSVDEVIGALEKWFKLNGAFPIGDCIPWLDFLDLQGYKKNMKIGHKKIDRFMAYVVNDHKTKRELAGNDFVAKDLVDVLLQVSNDPNTEVKISEESVKALVQDVLTGGLDTSPVTLDWCMSELLKKPYLLEKATEELDRVIGRERWVEEKDTTQLPFIDAIIKETFRLHAPGTILAPHFSTEDCIVDGYHIPKGTTLLVNKWALHRDPRYWDKAEEFIPERFIENKIVETDRNFEYLPFGAGRRMCPGYKLGLRMVKTGLANLIHGFTWKLPDNMKPDDVNMEEEYGLTTHRKFPITAILEPRLPAYMYEF